MARIMIVMMLGGLIWITGCELAHAPEVVDLSKKDMCYFWAGEIDIDADYERTDGHQAASNALSAWCWSPTCLQNINLILGEDVSQGLRKKFNDLMNECQGCFPTASVRGRVMYLKKVQDICDKYPQYRRREA